MIELHLEGEVAVALIAAIEREVDGYTEDPTCCPQRVIKLRELLVELDEKLEEKVEEARIKMKAEAEESNDE